MRPHYRVVRAFLRALCRLFYGLRVEGAEKVPREGGMILAVNHTSYFDPVLAGCGCPRELRYFAKRELFRNPFFAALIRTFGAFPVDRGAVTRETLREVGRILGGGGVLLLFPEGTRSLDGKVRDARPGLGMMALHAGVPVVPTYLHGTREMRRRLFRRGRFTVAFADPVDPAGLAGESRKEKQAELGARVTEKIRDLQSIYG